MIESKFKKILYSRASVFVLLLACIWLGLALAKAIYKKYQLDKEIASVKSGIEKLDKNSQELTQTLNYFQNQDFLEKEAKAKLNLKKEGETVVMVSEAAIGQLPQMASSSSQETGSRTLTETKNNLLKWWEYFFAK